MLDTRPSPLRLCALQRALELSGGPYQLAAELQVRRSDLELMVNGLSHVPERIFLKVIDLLSDVAAEKSAGRAPASAKTDGGFEWLPIDAFNRLTAEQKDRYLLQLARQLDLDLSDF